MTHLTTQIGRTARKLLIVTFTLLVAATGTAAAHGGGNTGGMMGGGWGGLGLLGGGMVLWPLLLVGIVLLVAYSTTRTNEPDSTDRALAELRERYARGELSDEEYESRRASLTR